MAEEKCDLILNMQWILTFEVPYQWKPGSVTQKLLKIIATI